MAGKKRLDLLLVERGLVSTRSRARAAIMAGQVLVDNQVVDKAGALVPDSAQVELKGGDLPFVSRGGLKLAKAIKEFGIDLRGRKVLDIGASTGGFTDCCLQAGAALVYAVDVGYGQLAWSLRTNPAVVNLERTNVRYLSREQLTRGLPDFACIDVSFISLRLVLPVVAELLAEPGEVVMLIKPQFEAGREQVGKGGVVRDAKIHRQVLAGVLAKAEELGFVLWHLDFSPVQGPHGNIEYLAHGFFRGPAREFAPPSPEYTVKKAHEYFAQNR
ncbi:MAG: TlyA family RNA methyltransferase [Firmicutes bacterium]|nr:TlyA family RNA methyltransferase [Bacillota bacterium]